MSARELDSVRKRCNVSSTSYLKGFNLILDKNLLIRVGSRLENSNLPFDDKHQLILPGDHKLTKLIFEYYHKNICTLSTSLKDSIDGFS